MPGFGFSFKLTGADSLEDKLEDKRLIGVPLRRMFKSSVKVLHRRVVPKTPVDLGELKNSYQTGVDAAPIPKWAKLWSSVKHAPWVEWNTKPHWPPWGPGSKLAGWAGRKGITPFLVARAISIRGTKGKHMFEEALKESTGDLRRLFSAAMRDIEKLWGRK